MADHAPGYITASTVAPFLTGTSDKLLTGGKNAAKKIAAERCGLVRLEPSFTGNDATEWGLEHEDEAIRRYEEIYFVDVYGRQDVVKDGWKSCTPDGLVFDEGLVEVKCPYNSLNHMDNLLDNAWLKDYENQCQFQMMLTGREWVDLISYDPRWKSPLDIHVVRIDVDEEWQKFCRNRLKQAEVIIEETIKQLKSKLEKAAA